MSSPRKNWVLSIVGIAVAFLLGLQVGRWWLGGDSQPVPEDSESSNVAGAVGGGAAGGAAGTVEDLRAQNEELKEELARLQTKLAVQSVAAAGRSGEGVGEDAQRRDKYAPMKWPDNTPPEYRPEGFEEIITKVVAEANGEMELTGLHCDEPPCMAAFRVSPAVEGEKYGERFLAPLVTTEAWKKHYDKMIGHHGISAQCGDGRSERVSFLWKMPDEWDEHFVDDALARRWIRVREILDNWKCLPAP